MRQQTGKWAGLFGQREFSRKFRGADDQGRPRKRKGRRRQEIPQRLDDRLTAGMRPRHARPVLVASTAHLFAAFLLFGR